MKNDRKIRNILMAFEADGEHIVSIIPAKGKNGQENTLVGLRGGSRGQVLLPFPVRGVTRMLAHLLRSDWDFAEELGAQYLTGADGMSEPAPVRKGKGKGTKHGGIYPLSSRMILLALRIRKRSYHNQKCWGYLNVAEQVERIEKTKEGCELYLASGGKVPVYWTCETVARKLREGRYVYSRAMGQIPGWPQTCSSTPMPQADFPAFPFLPSHLSHPSHRDKPDQTDGTEHSGRKED